MSARRRESRSDVGSWVTPGLSWRGAAKEARKIRVVSLQAGACAGQRSDGLELVAWGMENWGEAFGSCCLMDLTRAFLMKWWRHGETCIWRNAPWYVFIGYSVPPVRGQLLSGHLLSQTPAIPSGPSQQPSSSRITLMYFPSHSDPTQLSGFTPSFSHTAELSSSLACSCPYYLSTL